MFEKEAIKDYVDNLEGKIEVNNESRLEEQFEDTFRRGAICGYNKANEWHYVKDGDLPKDEKLCLIWCGEKDFNIAEYVRERFWDLCGGWLEVDEVIAWKEIVLPKESK